MLETGASLLKETVCEARGPRLGCSSWGRRCLRCSSLLSRWHFAFVLRVFRSSRQRAIDVVLTTKKQAGQQDGRLGT